MMTFFKKNKQKIIIASIIITVITIGVIILVYALNNNFHTRAFDCKTKNSEINKIIESLFEGDQGELISQQNFYQESPRNNKQCYFLKEFKTKNMETRGYVFEMSSTINIIEHYVLDQKGNIKQGNKELFDIIKNYLNN